MTGLVARLLAVVFLVTGCASAPRIPAGQILLTTNGAGTGDTQSFTAPSEWRVEYAADCSAMPPLSPGVPTLIIYVRGKQTIFGQETDDMAALYSGSGEPGTAYAHMAGKVYLSVTSPCPWAIVAKAG